MRDDTHKWDAPFPASSVLTGEVDGKACRVSSANMHRLTLISGSGVQTSSELPLIGWPEIAPDGPFALSLRRDRILEVNGPARTDGWDELKSLAISDMTDGYHAFSVDGPGALGLLHRGADVFAETPSASVARLIFGLPALVYRTGETAFSLVFTRAQAVAAYSALSTALRHCAPVRFKERP
ncbi:hypothetical protein [Chachezhania antarctica]|uniref:hypothetical protein n=1 Tax=Chachezhania antarctica TaxID=2340860 RepID=UPI0013CE4A4F|nr:hypothetical protein [Chachezhania antarctica]|tara:strand:+ start:6080 stop:6625 length:546 start_codon:yes stop_codon:yes gene_type:complete